MTTKQSLLLAALCFSLSLNAQQLPQFSSWLLQPALYNPAATGLDPSVVLTGTYRKQWLDLAGAPASQHFNVAMPVPYLRSGIGLRFDNDVIAAHQTSRFLLNYSYHLNTGVNSRLSLGVGAGYMQYVLDGSKLRAPDGSYTDPVFQHNDPNLPLSRVTSGVPLAEAALMWSNEQWQIGAGVQPVFAPVVTSESLRFTPHQHYTFQTIYHSQLSDELSLQSGCLLKGDAAVWQIEVNTLLGWKDKYFAGAGWRGITSRQQDALMLAVGTRLNERALAIWNYDLPVSGLKNTNRGSHELTIRYSIPNSLNTGKLPPVIYNPRFR